MQIEFVRDVDGVVEARQREDGEVFISFDGF